MQLKQIALIAACGIIPFSCKKPANNEMMSKDDLAETAALVKGTVLFGSLTGESDADALNLAYNSGRKYIILPKICRRTKFVGQYSFCRCHSVQVWSDH